MRLIEAQSKLISLKEPVIQTSDASACLKITRQHASKILERLAHMGIIIKIKRGLWGFSEKFDPLLLPEYLTAPYPSYISLQSALFYHGIISQIPNVIYAVSVGRGYQYKTTLGTISIHHIEADFFFGFEAYGGKNIKMALPEKALLDILYLTSTRSKLFLYLPELELPKTFDIKKAFFIISKVSSKRIRTIMKKRLEDILKKTDK